MLRSAFLLLALTLGGCASLGAGGDAEPRELVVLVHGMGRSPLSMAALHVGLRREGYRTLNFGYNSFGPSIAEIAEQLGAELDGAMEHEPPPRVHFVTHSLGGIVVRQLLETDRPDALGRVVMLAPPNGGSHEADKLAGWLGWMFRPMRELRTENSTVSRMAPPRDVEVAVIAGDRDGKVSVEETRLEGAEHVVVRSAHTFIMTKPSVGRLVRCFLSTGELGDCETEADGS